jgi:predicted DNA-binding ribbon-helix-helix protein
MLFHKTPGVQGCARARSTELKSKVHALRLKVHSTSGRLVQWSWRIMKHLNQADDSNAAFTLIELLG